MNSNKFLAIFILSISLVACDPASSEAEVTPETATSTGSVQAISSQPVATSKPTNQPTATNLPPTATENPTDTPTPVPTNTPEPTETPTPTETAVSIPPIQITTDDGCTLVKLNPESWSPLYAGFTGGGDPFFQFHTQEDSFYFNVELYTQYGAGWTGQLGTFAPNCDRNGICAYLVPDAQNPYLATDGEVEIISLEEVSGVITSTVEIELTNLTLQPVPGTNSPGCYHVDDVTLTILDTE